MTPLGLPLCTLYYEVCYVVVITSNDAFFSAQNFTAFTTGIKKMKKRFTTVQLYFFNRFVDLCCLTLLSIYKVFFPRFQGILDLSRTSNPLNRGSNVPNLSYAQTFKVKVCFSDGHCVLFSGMILKSICRKQNRFPPIV